MPKILLNRSSRCDIQFSTFWKSLAPLGTFNAFRGSCLILFQSMDVEQKKVTIFKLLFCAVRHLRALNLISNGQFTYVWIWVKKRMGWKMQNWIGLPKFEVLLTKSYTHNTWTVTQCFGYQKVKLTRPPSKMSIYISCSTSSYFSVFPVITPIFVNTTVNNTDKKSYPWVAIFICLMFENNLFLNLSVYN